MSLPREGTTFGELELDGKAYDMFSRPLNDESSKAIKKYQQMHGVGLTTAPWTTNKYRWIIKDYRLYLSHIHFHNDTNANAIKEIFHENKKFADWVNKDIKILISKRDILKIEASMSQEEINAIEKKGRAFVQRDVKILSFLNGELLKVSETITERYIESMRLKDYIEE